MASRAHLTASADAGPINWDDIRFFLELAECGTLSAAARSMKVAHATVGRRLAGIEQNLGLQLFDRGPDGYRLRPEGHPLLEQAHAMRRAAATISLSRAAQDAGLQGTVRLTATRTLADEWVTRQLAPLRIRHPGITVELQSCDQNLSLARHEVDLALRLARPTGGDYVIRRMATMANAFYVTTNPAIAHRLEQQRQFITFARDSTVPESVWLQKHLEGQIAFRSSSLAGQRNAALAGLGIALLPCHVGDPDPHLQRVALGRTPPAREVWLLVNRTHAKVPHIRAVAQSLAEAFERHRPAFEGLGPMVPAGAP